jgi:hypothetical protein
MATNEDILVECGGRAQGADTGSFRAEGYGILAILRLTFHLRFFYVTRNPSLTFKLDCDSESLLKRITASRALKCTLPRRFLFSEVDVEIQILSALLQSLVTPVIFEHVEGHQDTKYPNQPLQWAAQLNQRCDKIATAHLESATTTLPTVPFRPASQVCLSVGKLTITHHTPTQLRTLAELPDIRAHLGTQHGWATPAIFDLVDWPLFYAATLATSFLKRLFIIKWINSLLPCQKQQYRFQQSPSASCPSASGCVDEDWVHFPRCPHRQ